MKFNYLAAFIIALITHYSSASINDNITKILNSVSQSSYSQLKNIEKNILHHKLKKEKSRLYPQITLAGDGAFGRSRISLILKQNIYSGGLIASRIDLVNTEKKISEIESNVSNIDHGKEALALYFGIIYSQYSLQYLKNDIMQILLQIQKKFTTLYRKSAVSISDLIDIKKEIALLEQEISINSLNLARQKKLLFSIIDINLNSLDFSLNYDQIDINAHSVTELKPNTQYIEKQQELLKLKQNAENIKEQLDNTQNRTTIALIARERYDTVDKFEFTGGLSVNIPLFAGFESKHRKNEYNEKKKALSLESKIQLNKIQDSMLLDLKQLEESKKMIALFTDLLEVSLKAWRQVYSEFKLGTTARAKDILSTLNTLKKLRLDIKHTKSVFFQNYYALKHLN